MDAHRVDVLDRADHHDVVALVAHELELVLLPPDDRLLEEDLGGRRCGKAGAGDAVKIRLVVCDAGSSATHREGRAYDDWVLEVVDGGEALLHRVAHETASGLGRETRVVDRGDDVLELLAILPRLDRFDIGADELDVVALENTRCVQRHRAVERRLPAERGQQRVRALFGDDLLDVLRSDRLDVGRVGELGVGHDRRRVAVDQHHAKALGLEHAARLSARVVELARLPDDDRPRADHHDRAKIFTTRHETPPSGRRSGRRGRPSRAAQRLPRGGTERRMQAHQGIAAPRRHRR